MADLSHQKPVSVSFPGAFGYESVFLEFQFVFFDEQSFVQKKEFSIDERIAHDPQIDGVFSQKIRELAKVPPRKASHIHQIDDLTRDAVQVGLEVNRLPSQKKLFCAL